MAEHLTLDQEIADAKRLHEELYGPRAPLRTAPDQAPAIDTGTAMTGKQLRENVLAKALAAKDDYSDVQRIRAGNRAGAQKDINSALLMSLKGDEAMQKLGAAIFEKSLASVSPMRLNAADTAYEGADGEIVEAPAAATARKVKIAEHDIAAQEKSQGRIDSLMALQAEQDRRRQADIDRNKNNSAGQVIKIFTANTAADRAAAKGGGDGVVKGLIAPNGMPVYNRDGLYTTKDGTVIPNPMSVADFGKRSKELIAGEDAYGEAQRLLADAEANPKAFGLTSKAIDFALPKAMGIKSYALEKALTADENDVRTALATRSAGIIHALSGAAVSMGEFERLDRFLPTETDTPVRIQQKLQSALKKYEEYKKVAMSRKAISADPRSLPPVEENVDHASGAAAEIARRKAAAAAGQPQR